MLKGLLCPYIKALCVFQGDQRLWKNVFYIGAGVSMLGTLAYCILIKDKEQPWAKPDKQQEEQNKQDDEIPKR